MAVATPVAPVAIGPLRHCKTRKNRHHLLLLPRIGFGVCGVFLAEPISNVLGGLASYLTMRMTVYKQINRRIE